MSILNSFSHPSLFGHCEFTSNQTVFPSSVSRASFFECSPRTFNHGSGCIPGPCRWVQNFFFSLVSLVSRSTPWPSTLSPCPAHCSSSSSQTNTTALSVLLPEHRCVPIVVVSFCCIQCSCILLPRTNPHSKVDQKYIPTYRNMSGTMKKRTCDPRM
jgi:hypothetical protein